MASRIPVLQQSRGVGTMTAAPITRLTPLSDLPELLSVLEAATWLHIGLGLTYELVRRGDLPSVRLGRLVRVPRAGLIAVLGTPRQPEFRHA